MNNEEDIEIMEEGGGEEPFRSGFVTILGKPNVGKSTLMNKIIGEKLAIVTPKAQTTRDLILGIFTDEEAQVVFQDIPGVIDPKDKFNECLMANVQKALESTDVIYHLVDVHDKYPMTDQLAKILEGIDNPVFLVINKLDLLKDDLDFERFFKETGLEEEDYDEIIPISAYTGRNVSTLIDVTKDYLPAGPMYYEPDQLCDKDQRFLCAEIVREKVFELTKEEIPYSIATQVDEFKEKEKGKFLIRVTIFVERDSQKGMIIGKNGEMLKQIGSLARVDIEKLLDHPVFLELWVKVRKNWKKSPEALKEFGYKNKK